jgi:hypothetical protein
MRLLTGENQAEIQAQMKEKVSTILEKLDTILEK